MQMKKLLFAFSIAISAIVYVVFPVSSAAASPTRLYAYNNASFLTEQEQPLYALGKREGTEKVYSKFTALTEAVSSNGNYAFGDGFIAYVDNELNIRVSGKHDYIKDNKKPIIQYAGIIAAGNDHLLALDFKYNLYTIGKNNNGQLGTGDLNNQTKPQKILDEVMTIAAGGNTSFAIDIKGNLYGWGNNNYGQLGNGNKKNQNKPVLIAKNVEQVWTNGSSTFIKSSGGIMYACGKNTNGQLGLNDTSDTVLLPKEVGSYHTVSIGKTHTLLLDEYGILYGCGSNKYAQLGLENAENYVIPTKIQEDVDQIACGNYHSLYQDKNGILFGTGNNKYYQIGEIKQKTKWREIQMPDRFANKRAAPPIKVTVQTFNNIENYLEQNDYPEKYAGIYEKNGIAVIMVVGMDKETIELFKQIAATDAIEFEDAEYNYATLMKEFKIVEKYMSKNTATAKNIVSVEIYGKDNSIRVTLINVNASDIKDFQRYVTSSQLVTIVQGNAEYPL